MIAMICSFLFPPPNVVVKSSYMAAGTAQAPKEVIRVTLDLKVIPGKGFYRSPVILVTLKNVGILPVLATDLVNPGRGLEITFEGPKGAPDLEVPRRGDSPEIQPEWYKTLGPQQDFRMCFRWSHVFLDLPANLQGPSKLIGRIYATYDVTRLRLPRTKIIPVCTGPIRSNSVGVILSPNHVRLAK